MIATLETDVASKKQSRSAVTLAPIQGKVLLDPIRMELKQGSIILPTTADYELPTCGRVLKLPEQQPERIVCPHCREQHNYFPKREFKVGDLVLFHRDDVVLLNHEGHQYALVPEIKIVGIMDE